VLAEMELTEGLSYRTTVRGDEKARRVAQLKIGQVPLVELHAPYVSEFVEQLEHVFSFADLRSERTGEVLSQVVPQTAYWSAIAGLTPERHRYTLELLGVGLRFAMMAVMQFKFLLNCPRPSEYSALVQPMILTPGYSAFPSGHATEAYFAAEVLAALHPKATSAAPEELDNRKVDVASLRGQLHRLAFRVAENRVVAGLHFPVDSLAGQLLGVSLAEYFLGRCRGSAVKPRAFGADLGSGKMGRFTTPQLDTTIVSGCMTQLSHTIQPEAKHVLGALWARSRNECEIVT
jgi:membrane-associated phospholipid phosphatase